MGSGAEVADHTIASEGQAERQPLVLLVEDEIIIRLAAADMLREQGFAVLEAVDAAEALSLLQANESIDLVITDVRMPGEMNGVALTREVKKHWPNLPVAIISGHLPPDEAHEADHFLRKPVTSEQLAQVAKELIDPLWQSRTSNSKHPSHRRRSPRQARDRRLSSPLRIHRR